MNLRKIWTELFHKPTARLILFLLAGALVLAFVFSGKGRRSPQPVNPTVPAQATTAKGYSFTEDIPATSPARPPTQIPPTVDQAARPGATPKAPSPIPQAIFATKEAPRSETYLPYGRLIRCELVNTVDSTNIETPIIGLITEDLWHGGRLIVPAGTEVHGLAQKTAARERIGSERKWMLVFQDGRELPLSGTVLDYAPDGSKPDEWGETDGSAGLRGYLIAADKYGEAKAILAAMISAGAGAFPQMTNVISPLTGGVTQVQGEGIRTPSPQAFRRAGKFTPSAFSKAWTKTRTTFASLPERSSTFTSIRPWIWKEPRLAFPPLTQTLPQDETPHTHPDPLLVLRLRLTPAREIGIRSSHSRHNVFTKVHAFRPDP